MIICPVCEQALTIEGSRCLRCGFAPEIINGFAAWAPELVEGYEGFPAEGFAALVGSEANNFWFQARNRLILWALETYFPRFTSLLEVGCGTGFVLSGIAERFPQARLVGSEIHTAGLVHAQQRLPTAQLLQMDARRMPFAAEFEVVGAFDVIEHIEEDETALANLFRAVQPQGGLLLTVPQHDWLWSPVDELACHQRRYRAADLHRKITAAGFHILMSTSFVSLLLPAMVLSRVIGKRSGGATASTTELRPNSALNSVFSAIMHLERLTIENGLRWSLGGSRLVVAQKADGY